MADDNRYLTEADIEMLAEKAADRALEKVYADLGKSVAKKIFWFIGVAAIGVAIWLSGNGGTIPKV
jgi:hypothetical protein|tara:strand:- start:3961 stop:4158 length:198 start_codon:yes stop_codon:yes gene_type:complete